MRHMARLPDKTTDNLGGIGNHTCFFQFGSTILNQLLQMFAIFIELGLGLWSETETPNRCEPRVIRLAEPLHRVRQRAVEGRRLADVLAPLEALRPISMRSHTGAPLSINPDTVLQGGETLVLSGTAEPLARAANALAA